MDSVKQLFLQALRASLKGESVAWDMGLSADEWVRLFSLAETHSILPMIFEAVYACPDAKRLDAQFFAPYRQRTLHMVTAQTMKTEEFLMLYRTLTERGISPIVVKGIVCRELYPKPDYRKSGDEDLLISEAEFACCHQAMLDYGMMRSDPAQDISEAFEVSYGKPGSPVYIELHKCLFDPTDEAYGDLNRYFADVYANGITLTLQGTKLAAMNHTDHLFYLICHAFKHFLHGGFGIRQVCDITLYANAYGSEIDWLKILANCSEIRAVKFAAALFAIGEKYLTFTHEIACWPKEWSDIQVDETMMLDDLLESGIYGDSTMSRKHSSTLTLEALAAEKQGKTVHHANPLKSAFPTAKQLEGRYPYLKNRPFLLPVAWTDRLLKYRKETKANGGKDNNAAESIRIGNERIALMKEYGILKK